MRRCSACRAVLSSHNPGGLCFPCLDKQREKMNCGDRPYYDIHEMAYMMGLDSEEQPKRWARKGLIPGRIPLVREYRFNKEVIDEWIKSGGLPLHRPTNPLQQQAYSLCLKKDHTWFCDEKFDGIAYGTEPHSELGEYAVHVMNKRTCYFCGHSEIVSI